MKIILLGSNGQIGWELQRSLAPLGQLLACDRETADFEELNSLYKLVLDFNPDVIVNAAGYTSVDKAENEPDKASQINSEAVIMLAQVAIQLGCLLVHYSTDYVFDGLKEGAYTEIDKTNPLSVYGKTKLLGEKGIQEIGCKHIIFRTSWVYALHGTNFVNTIIQLAKKQYELKVVNDQIGSPIRAELIADITSLCLYRIAQEKNSTQNMIGIYNLTTAGETNWHGFAKYIITIAEKRGATFLAGPEKIIPVKSSEFFQKALRPANSLLDSQKLCCTFNIYLPSWQTSVDRLIKELYL